MDFALDNEKQISRFNNAKKILKRTFKISIENKSGRFGDPNVGYLTTLDSCECMDFRTRKLPCKHMFRLAIELGVLNPNISVPGINSPASNDSKSTIAKFSIWSATDSPSQHKRLEKARSAENTPISVSIEEKFGEFGGSHGVYHTSLEFCECYDFASRQLPCKHIYRLAIELGELQGVVESDISKATSPSNPSHYTTSERNDALLKFSEIIEPRSDLLPWICKLLYRGTANNTCVCFDIVEVSYLIDNGLVSVAKNPLEVLKMFSQRKLLPQVEAAGISIPTPLKLKRDQYGWCLDNAEMICDILYPNSGILSPDGLLKITPHKINSFASRRQIQLEYGYTDLSEDETVNELLKKHAPDNKYSTVFEDMTFVITGTFNTMSREDISETIKNAGGKVSGSVSKKTTFLIAGEDCGIKLQKAKELGIPIISEDEFFKMLDK